MGQLLSVSVVITVRKDLAGDKRDRGKGLVDLHQGHVVQAQAGLFQHLADGVCRRSGYEARLPGHAGGVKHSGQRLQSQCIRFFPAHEQQSGRPCIKPGCVACCDRWALVDGWEPGELLRFGFRPGELVLDELYRVPFSLRDLDPHDFIRKFSGLVRPFPSLLAPQCPAVLLFPSDAVFHGHIPGILGQRSVPGVHDRVEVIFDFGLREPGGPAHVVEHKRRVAHVFRAHGQHHVRFAQQDVPKPHLHARKRGAAGAIQGQGERLRRKTRLEQGLARIHVVLDGGLGLNAHAVVHHVHVLTRHGDPVQDLPHDHGAQFDAVHVPQNAPELAERGPDRADNDNLF